MDLIIEERLTLDDCDLTNVSTMIQIDNLMTLLGCARYAPRPSLVDSRQLLYFQALSLHLFLPFVLDTEFH